MIWVFIHSACAALQTQGVLTLLCAHICCASMHARARHVWGPLRLNVVGIALRQLCAARWGVPRWGTATSAGGVECGVPAATLCVHAYCLGRADKWVAWPAPHPPLSYAKPRRRRARTKGPGCTSLCVTCGCPRSIAVASRCMSSNQKKKKNAERKV